MPSAEKGGKEESFDERLQRLETIVAELEGGKLPLEPAIERYQEGIGLLRDCHGTLERYRKRVEELSAEAEGSLRPFADDPDAGAKSAGAPNARTPNARTED
jgi:exodeoxyribonuclease VII small subunit